MIKHIGNFNDRPTEGMTKISSVIRTIKCDKNIMHFHGNGIGGVLKSFLYDKHDMIYSLYTNLDVEIRKRKKNIIKTKNRFGTKTKFMIKHLFFSILSYAIPFRIKRMLLRGFKKVIVPTNYLKDCLDLKNVVVIPFGIDTNKFTPSFRNYEKIVISYIGSASYEKGFDKTIEVFKKLNNNINLDLRMYLPAIPKNFKFPEGVKVYGTIDDIENVYKETHIVLLPHLTTVASIGIPLVMLEAMSSGCVVITTPLPHIKEVGKDNVIYSNNLTEDILRLSKDIKKLKLLGIKARKHIIENYSEKKMLDSYKKLYEDIE